MDKTSADRRHLFEALDQVILRDVLAERVRFPWDVIRDNLEGR